MERLLNPEERIRRAEEIYYNKKNINIKQENKISFKLLKKIFFQLLLSFIIYVLIFFIQAKNFIFSNYVLEKTKYILSYDVNIGTIKLSIAEFWTDKVLSIIKKNNNVEPKEQTQNQEIVEENIIDDINVIENDVGATNTEEISSISQMAEDAEYIKNNVSIIKPLIGTITSEFGVRNPTTITVPTYHTGIDIAVNEGTIFIAAMDGTVELVSSQGDYRESCKNCFR